MTERTIAEDAREEEPKWPTLFFRIVIFAMLAAIVYLLGSILVELREPTVAIDCMVPCAVSEP